ncbi:hypothetical protein [Dehalococcoides mccartyi]|uniref:hypothetical protein n=1 Tax=Dehalococcoides mccartyi TaxID=61435 RepID=UPI00055196BE|nr:hypothetical protein [Dehalococcoides mccartyi]
MKQERNAMRTIENPQSKNRLSSESHPDGRTYFREYWIHEWNGRGYNLSERIKDINEAIKRAIELGYEDDANKLQRIRQGELGFEPIQ